MNKSEFIERTAAGLRNMNIKPFCLLLNIREFESLDWCYDEDTLCGLPVLFATINDHGGYDGVPIGVTPLFKEDRSHISIEIYHFQRGYRDNYKSTKTGAKQ